MLLVWQYFYFTMYGNIFEIEKKSKIIKNLNHLTSLNQLYNQKWKKIQFKVK